MCHFNAESGSLFGLWNYDFAIFAGRAAKLIRFVRCYHRLLFILKLLLVILFLCFLEAVKLL